MSAYDLTQLMNQLTASIACDDCIESTEPNDDKTIAAQYLLPTDDFCALNDLTVAAR